MCSWTSLHPTHQYPLVYSLYSPTIQPSKDDQRPVNSTSSYVNAKSTLLNKPLLFTLLACYHLHPVSPALLTNPKTLSMWDTWRINSMNHKKTSWGLPSKLHESQEDLNVMMHCQQLKESLLIEEIASLKAKLGEGGSGRHGGPGSSSGRY